MSPRTERQFKKIRQEKRRLIIDTALELFAKEGYHVTSISKIAKKANISKGLLYNYFNSKEELLSSVIHLGIKEMYDEFDPNKDGILTKDELAHFIKFAFKTIRNKKRFWILYFTLFIQPGIFMIIQKDFAELQKRVMEVALSFFKNEGYENPMCEMMMFGAVLDGLAFQYIMAKGDYPIEELEDYLLKKYRLT
jgi:AcrR family transcriptional regulator